MGKHKKNKQDMIAKKLMGIHEREMNQLLSDLTDLGPNDSVDIKTTLVVNRKKHKKNK